MIDTIRHGGGVAERGESDWGRHEKTNGVEYLKGEGVRGGERARHKETSGVEYLERKRVDMTYGSCWFTQTC